MLVKNSKTRDYKRRSGKTKLDHQILLGILLKEWEWFIHIMALIPPPSFFAAGVGAMVRTLALLHCT